MSSEKPTYILLDKRESLGQSIVADIVTFGFLLLCIWASQGSTWWTFCTGVLFLFFGAAKVGMLISERQHKFKNVQELHDWTQRELTKGARP